MTIEDYIKNLSNLQKIMGVYEEAVSEFCKNAKYFRKKYVRKRLKDFEKRINFSLTVFDTDIKQKSTSTKGNIDISTIEKDIDKKRSKLKEFFTNLFSEAQKKEQDIEKTDDVCSL